jgi:RNA polymerase sigma-70 factor (sigma-E family)
VRERDAAFEAFFIAEQPLVLRTVRFIVGDPQTAQDLTQEAFYKLLLHWRKVSQYERPGAWVRRVAIRLAMRVRHVRTGSIEVATQGDIAQDMTRRVDVREALRRITPLQRAAVVLFYYEDRPVQEIASMMDCSEGTVKTHLHRARARLAPMLGEEIDDVAR